MPRPLGFRDFINVDYAPGMPDDIKYQAVKRKRAQQGGGPDEELSVTARRKMARSLRRRKRQIAMARKRALRKTADQGTIKQRAKKQARLSLFKKLSKGKAPSELSPQRRAGIQKRLSKMSGRIDKLAVRNIPKARRLDRERKKSKR